MESTGKVLVGIGKIGTGIWRKGRLPEDTIGQLLVPQWLHPWHRMHMSCQGAVYERG